MKGRLRVPNSERRLECRYECRDRIKFVFILSRVVPRNHAPSFIEGAFLYFLKKVLFLIFIVFNTENLHPLLNLRQFIRKGT